MGHWDTGIFDGDEAQELLADGLQLLVNNVRILMFAVLACAAFAGCRQKDGGRAEMVGRVESTSSPPLQARYGMEFTWIPPSGDQWKEECRQRGIAYKPVAGFFLQTRELSLTQYRAMGGDVAGYSTLTDVDWSQSAIVPSWVEAVNGGHALSTNDPKFEYRLPTIHEWIYAYRYQTNAEQSGQTELKFEEVKTGHFEFATDSVLDIPLPIGYETSHAKETARRSFAMGQPYGYAEDKPDCTVIANGTPPTGDDGIDEQTFVRFVLIPKSGSNPAAPSR